MCFTKKNNRRHKFRGIKKINSDFDTQIKTPIVVIKTNKTAMRGEPALPDKVANWLANGKILSAAIEFSWRVAGKNAHNKAPKITQKAPIFIKYLQKKKIC